MMLSRGGTVKAFKPLLAVLLALAATACGDDDDAAEDTGAATATTGAATTGAATTGAATTGTETTGTETTGTETTGGMASGELSLMVAQYSDKTQPFWEGLISDFEAANPDVSVALEVVSWEQINDVISTRVQTGDAPDILNIDAFATFAADDLLRPADEVLSPDKLADIIPSFAENATIDGVQYGIPLIASSRALFYNTDLFEQAGISEPPATWDELRAAAQAIVDLPGDEIGYAMPLGPEEAQAESSIWMFGNGGGWVDDSGEFAIDSPENVEAFEYMSGLVADELTQPNPATTDRADAQNLFFEGQIGMIEGLPPFLQFIAEDHPDLNFAVAPSPTKSGEPSTLGVADHMMVFNNEGNTEAAKAFLDFFYTTDNYVSFVDTEGFLPVTTSGSEAMAPNFSPEEQPFLEALPTAKFYPSSIPAWGAVQGAVQQEIGEAVEGDPAEVLGDLQATAEEEAGS
jgi:multiple sugar transport system substrate-binding protein